MTAPKPLTRMALITVCACFVITTQAAGENFEAVDYQRRAIYHSPQTPGFTSWTGAWTMPDGSLMICFAQATGPVEGRPRAPKEVQHQLSWPPAGRPGYDMTGLDLRNVHLRSQDGGKTWQHVSADPFKSCMNGITGEAQTALADGTIIRGVWGYYLPYNPELPKTGYYPRAIQAADGHIFIFGHVGGDDAYGKTDQSIVMNSFRLVKKN